MGYMKKFRALWRSSKPRRAKESRPQTEAKISEETTRTSRTESSRYSDDIDAKHDPSPIQPTKSLTRSASFTKDVVVALPPVLPEIPATEPLWPDLFRSRTPEQPGTHGEADSFTSPPSPAPPILDTYVPSTPTVPPEDSPPSRPASKSGTPVIPPLIVVSDSNPVLAIHRVSSLDHLASAYSSGKQSPEPESIFETQLKESKNPSPASTISAGANEYTDTAFALLHAREDIIPAYVPKPLIVRPKTVANPTATTLEHSYTPLTNDEVRKMRSRLSVISFSSSEAEESDVPSAAIPVPVAESERDICQRTIATISEDAIDAIPPTENLPEDEPPPIPPKSARRNAILFPPTTDVLSNPLPPSSRTTSRFSLPPLDATTSRPVHPNRNPLARNTMFADLPPNWYTSAPLRHDSLLDTPPPRRHPYTRPKKTWYAVRERFLEIFDDAPTVKAGARRENPKIYQMRKRRTLLEMGLTENDLDEPTETRRGKEIMRLLDGLEERLMREREVEEARREEAGEERQEVRSSVRLSMVGVRCANDAVYGYSSRSRKGKEKAEEGKKYLW